MNRLIGSVLAAARRFSAWAEKHAFVRPVFHFARRHIPEMVAVATLVALIIGVNPPKLLRVFAHIDWRIAGLMVPVVLGTYVSRGLAWWIGLRKIGQRISVMRCLTVEFAGQVLVFLPLGDLARVSMVRKTSGDRGPGQLAGTIAFQELLFMMLLGFGVLPRVASQLDVAALVLVMTVLHIGVFTVLLWKPAYDTAVRVVEKVRILRRFDKQLRELRPAFVKLFEWDSLGPMLLLQTCATLLTFLLFYLALHAIGASHIGYVTAGFLLGLSYILSGFSFIPGGLGVFEGLLTLLMIANGVAPETGAAAGLLYRGYNDVLMALVGAPFALKVRRQPGPKTESAKRDSTRTTRRGVRRTARKPAS